MMKLFNTRTTSIVSFILLLCVSISLLWCSDSTCQDGQEDDCACLMCSLLKEHNSDLPNSASHHTNSCSCVCQLPICLDFHSTSFYRFKPEMLTVGLLLPVLSQPTQPLLKPPKLQALFSNFNSLFNQHFSNEDEPCLEYLSFHQPC